MQHKMTQEQMTNTMWKTAETGQAFKASEEIQG